MRSIARFYFYPFRFLFLAKSSRLLTSWFSARAHTYTQWSKRSRRREYLKRESARERSPFSFRIEQREMSASCDGCQSNWILVRSWRFRLVNHSSRRLSVFKTGRVSVKRYFYRDNVLQYYLARAKRCESGGIQFEKERKSNARTCMKKFQKFVTAISNLLNANFSILLR